MSIVGALRVPIGEQARDTTIDIARALAIVAIVAGHVLRGLAAGDLIDSSTQLYQSADLFIYTFHLAVFAFLAGLFVRRGVEKQGAWRYLWSRDATFLYLYVLWSLIQGGVKLLTSSLVNTPVTLIDVLDLAHPEGHLWFLPWLILITTITVAVRPWTRRSRATLSLAVALVASLAAWGYAGTVIGPEGISLWVFFVAGAVLGDGRFSAASLRMGPISAAFVGVLAAAAYVAGTLFAEVTAPTVGFETRTPLTVAVGLLLSGVGVLAVLAFARLIALLGGMSVALAWVGQRSLEIYLAHGVALSGTRIVLTELGISSLPVHILLGTAIGVVAPLALWWLTQRLRFPWLFVAPVFLLPSQNAPRG